MRTKKTIINSLSSFFSMTIFVLLNLFLVKTFTKNLGLEINGVNGVFNNIISILSISELGFAGAISYSLFKPIYEKNDKKISALMNYYKMIYSRIGFFIITTSIVISAFIPVFINKSSFDNKYISLVFIVFSINSAVSYFFSYNRTLYYSFQENYVTVIVDTIFRIAKVLIQLYLLNKYKNYILFLVVNIIFTYSNNFIIHLFAKKRFNNIYQYKEKIDKKTKAQLFDAIKSLAIIQVLSVSINFTDNIIISSIIGISAAGLFVNYNLIYTQINQFIGAIYNGIGASLGNLLTEKRKDRTKKVMYNYEYLGFFLSSFSVVCFLFLMQPFVGSIWLGKGYLMSNVLVYILSANLYLIINKQIINYYLRLGGNYKMVVKPLIIESVLNIVVSLVLVFKIGVEGVAIGTLVSSFVGWMLLSSRYSKSLNVSFSIYIRRQLFFISLIFSEITIIKLLTFILPINTTILYFIILLIVCVLINLFVSFMLIIKNKNLYIFLDILLKFKRRIKVGKTFS